MSEKHRLNPALTPACAKVLRLMVENDEELAVEGMQCWVGSHRTSRVVVKRLLEECLIAPDGRESIYYHPTPDAKHVLDDPDYETRWREHLRTGKPVYR